MGEIFELKKMSVILSGFSDADPSFFPDLQLKASPSDFLSFHQFNFVSYLNLFQSPVFKLTPKDFFIHANACLIIIRAFFFSFGQNIWIWMDKPSKIYSSTLFINIY